MSTDVKITNFDKTPINYRKPKSSFSHAFVVEHREVFPFVDAVTRTVEMFCVINIHNFSQGTKSYTLQITSIVIVGANALNHILQKVLLSQCITRASISEAY